MAREVISIDEEEFRRLFPTMTNASLAKHFGCSVDTIVARMKKFGLENTPEKRNAIRKSTNMERYGGISPNYDPEIRRRTAETNRRKYGDEQLFRTEYFRKKNRETFEEKYSLSTPNPAFIPGVREKIIATNRERYGYDYYLQTPESIQHRADYFRKYYRDHPELVEEIRERSRNWRVENPYQPTKLWYKGSCFDSGWEVNVAKACDRLGLSWKRFDRRKVEDGGEGLLSYTRVDGKHSLYGPDLVIEGYTVEVKGVFDLDAEAKVTSWREKRGSLSLLCPAEYEQFIKSESREEALQVLEESLNNSPTPVPYSFYLQSEVSYYGGASQ